MSLRTFTRRVWLAGIVVMLVVSSAVPAFAAPPEDRPLNLRTSDLYVSSVIINDGSTGGASGDGDGFVECGETVGINLVMTSVSKTISGAYVEVDPRGDAVGLVGSATAPLPSMSPGTTVSVGGTFVVEIAPEVSETEWLSLVVWVIPPEGEVFESHRHIPVGCGVTSGSTVTSPPIVFPVTGTNQYTDNGWHLTARPLIHEGVDIYAAKRTPVVAAANGVIATVNWENDPAHRGSILCCALALRHDSGWESWYIHLNNDNPGTDDGLAWGIAPGIDVGTRVVAGQLIGWVGDSGNAETTSPHIHFELHDPMGVSRNPYSYLQGAVSPGAVPCTQGEMACRVAGSDRFGTSAKLSEIAFPDGAETVFIATGRNYPDALAGAAVAAQFDAPILLVDTNAVPAAVAAELTRLNPSTIVILGGTTAVSAGVEATLGGHGAVVRLFGDNRYATAAAVSRYGFPAGSATVFIATGAGYVDALTGGPVAAVFDAPLLLVPPSGIPSEVIAELTRLAPTSIVVLGGTSAVSTAVETELAGYGAVTRLSGPNRYTTAAAISEYGFPGGADIAFIAVGNAYPDALAGAAAAAHLGAPLLIVESGAVPASIVAELVRLDPSTITILGGTSVVAVSVQCALTALI